MEAKFHCFILVAKCQLRAGQFVVVEYYFHKNSRHQSPVLCAHPTNAHSVT